MLSYPIPFGGAERNLFLGDSEEPGCLRFFDTAFDQAAGGVTPAVWLPVGLGRTLAVVEQRVPC